MNHGDTKRGHLHAGIVPWCRDCGIGTELLALALVECRKRGILKVHICPDSRSNQAAIRTIPNNGGYLLDELIDDGRVIERYEINLEN